MTPSTSRRDPVSREAERRRRRRVGHRRLALALSLLAIMILAIGLGVGLSGRGDEPGGTTSTRVGGVTSTSLAEGETTTSAPATGETAPGATTSTASEGATTSTASDGATTSTVADGGQVGGALTFRASLTGEAQVPAVSTNATGTLTLTVAADRSRVDYVLEVDGIRNLTIARLRQGSAGETGDVLATIYAGPTKRGTFGGVVTRGSLTAGDLDGPLEGRTIDDFLTLVQSGSVYVNVGTTANRAGEIRGQLLTAPATGQNGAAGSVGTAL